MFKALLNDLLAVAREERNDATDNPLAGSSV